MAEILELSDWESKIADEYAKGLHGKNGQHTRTDG